ncbi:copper resistance CopC family protein [Leucobacter luti]|uniref:CopC domain-containing protein n=1 Tax=Leucobacter luti TaxID=340320 RepID=A0A4Q7TU49_9MICO|nr:copper resistance CopC family protein [Leucobacter luti]MBL3698436.1 copper resistance protein CopC [Leucobacter luti]RZT64475.1 hypothetical protein EV139_1893 [Leucobacter luti]
MSRTAHARTSDQSAAPRRFTRVAAIALLAGAATLGVAAPALAHDELINTQLVVDDAANAVTGFELTFSNSIIEVGTEIVVTDADGTDVTGGVPEIAGPVVTQPLAKDLPAGEYAAAWRVVSSDGHPIEGAFGITVPAGGAANAAIVEADQRLEDAEHEAEGDHDHAAEGDHDHADDDAAHDHDAAGAADDTKAASGMPVGGIIAAVIGGVVVIAGGVTAAIVGNRRRAQGMAKDIAAAQAPTAQNHTDTASTEGDQK